ncbi:phosphosulfolactate synthase [Paenibacillus darwinianus]|uniref:Phosphosulfolactate synthase n=1 Tax=Paenibacillus darwinianus TaxID=1380763 RepID=A0A9W5S0U2_9BACL|nr:phosphosulfolactate synthase [Paenibacillus darwinianus]EXX86677.1 phosphosulfolactate synthase [Paenibacillus darwinianus]EXX86968.1 phosphosulfolactate synthase [Paenibacillus darwinianus]EXX91933.1 phosphosulfolactate synthase [Paenibacillus darwinianus]
MELTPRGAWHPLLCDPSGERDKNRLAPGIRCRSGGKTMVLDKGLGFNAYADLIESAGAYIDFIKLGFGTSPLYPSELLERKIAYAKQQGIIVMPGGTLLETAVHLGVSESFFETVCRLGFNGIEVSDGTIELDRTTRTALIRKGVALGLNVCTEYGKKLSGSVIDPYDLAVTAEEDWSAGADLVTIEARESGIDVGLFDASGGCDKHTFQTVLRLLPDANRILWEAPLKSQQVFLIKALGPDVHLGNIPPGDVYALEAMRRGLRNDTFPEARTLREADFYMI